MARPTTVPHLADILAAAVHWKERCLLADGAVLTAAPLWSSENIALLDQYFVQNPQPGKAPFKEKLQRQLEPAPPPVRQLAAEMLWLLFLFPSSIGGDKKRENVREVWSWAGQPLDANHELLKVLDYGIGSSGTAYNTYRPAELAFLVKLMQGWKDEGPTRQPSLLSDPWEFGNWVDSMPKTGERQFRHMLFYLLFPDTYERISSTGNKRDIVKAFSSVLTSFAPLQGDSDGIIVDRQLRAIRVALEKEHPDFDFYDPQIAERWKSSRPEPLEADPVSEHGSPQPLPSAVPLYSVDNAVEGVFMEKQAFEEILDILKSKRNVILQGPPGVGKSFIAHRLAYALIEALDKERVRFIQFHQSYSYEDFIEGYRPTGKGSSNSNMASFGDCARKRETTPKISTC